MSEYKGKLYTGSLPQIDKTNNVIKIAQQKSADADKMETQYKILNTNYQKMVTSLNGIKEQLNKLSNSDAYTGSDAQKILDGASDANKYSSKSEEILKAALVQLQQQIQKVRAADGAHSGGDGTYNPPSGSGSTLSGLGGSRSRPSGGGSNDSHHGGSSDWQSSWDKEVGDQIPDRPKPNLRDKGYPSSMGG